MDAESLKKSFCHIIANCTRIAYRLLENAADAEDLVQEAYLKLWDKGRTTLSVIRKHSALLW